MSTAAFTDSESPKPLRVPFLRDVDPIARLIKAPEVFRIPVPVRYFNNALLTDNYFIERCGGSEYLRHRIHTLSCRLVYDSLSIQLDPSDVEAYGIKVEKPFNLVFRSVVFGHKSYVCGFHWAGTTTYFLDRYTSSKTLADMPELTQLLYMVSGWDRGEPEQVEKIVRDDKFQREKLTFCLDTYRQKAEREIRQSLSPADVRPRNSEFFGLMTDDEYEAYTGESR